MLVCICKHFVLLFFCIQSMAVHRFTAEMVLQMLLEEPDEEDEEAIGPDSEV